MVVAWSRSLARWQWCVVVFFAAGAGIAPIPTEASALEPCDAGYMLPVVNIPCCCDCHGDASVTVDELLAMVNIALGDADISVCPAGDTNSDHQITIDELLAAVNSALNGCPPDVSGQWSYSGQFIFGGDVVQTDSGNATIGQVCERFNMRFVGTWQNTEHNVDPGKSGPEDVKFQHVTLNGTTVTVPACTGQYHRIVDGHDIVAEAIFTGNGRVSGNRIDVTINGDDVTANFHATGSFQMTR